MSNVIRSGSFPAIEKKIIHTKKIISKKLDFAEPDMEMGEQKQFLTQEIALLEQRLQEVQETINSKQQQAKEEIDSWWRTKVEEAEKEALRLGEKATAEGYQAGFGQGMMQVEDEFRQKRQNMQELVEAVYEEKAQIIQQSEPFLLSMSVKIAEKIIKNELRQHDDQLLNIIKRALKHLEESEDIVMQVALEDYPIILPFLEELKTYIRADSELKLVPVAKLSKGGCMIHTASGSYDVTVDGQLEEIKRQLLAHCEEKAKDEPAYR